MLNEKKRGRPPTGEAPLTGLRLPQPTIDAIDRWASKTDDGGITRSGAIRRLIEQSLNAKGKTR
jgi:hypothetical protein